METSLVLLKPDTVDRGLIGQIISRFETKGLKISAMKMMQLDESIINDHYSFLMDKPFFSDIKGYMTRTPVVAMAISGENAIATLRTIAGATNPQEAMPGTIRGDFGITIDGNLMHASDSKETAEVELKRFFGEDVIYDYNRAIDKALYK